MPFGVAGLPRIFAFAKILAMTETANSRNDKIYTIENEFKLQIPTIFR